jgi:hypothetical protein
LRFLFETEDAYWRSMKNYLKKDLKTASIVFGTIIGCSTPNTMAHFDVIDTHAYWQHPVFPHKAWDNTDWYVKNSAMVNHPDISTILSLASAGILGKLHAVSEYNHPVPNAFETESFFLLTAYAVLQDWDVLIPFCYSHRLADWDSRQMKNYFDIDQNPLKLGSFISAAAAFLRGDISPARKRIVVPLNRRDEIEYFPMSYAWRLVDARSRGLNPLWALTHRIELAAAGQYVPQDSLSYTFPPADKSRFVSDTREIVWDISRKGRGLLTVDAALSKYIVDFGGGKRIKLSRVTVEIGDTALDGFAAVAFTVMQGSSFYNASRIVITAAGAQYNTGSVWYEYPKKRISFPPDEDAAITWRNKWGRSPTRV